MTEFEARLRRDLSALAEQLVPEGPGNVGAVAQIDAAKSAATRPLSWITKRRSPLVAAALLLAAALGVGAWSALRSDEQPAVTVAAQPEQESAEAARRAALAADPPTTLTEARARWEAEGPTEYRYRMEVTPAGITRDVAVDVVNGVATLLPHPQAAEAERIGITLPEPEPEWVATVEELFALAEQADPTVLAKFDPVFGYPTAFRIDSKPGELGGEVMFRTTELASLAEIRAGEQALARWLPEPTELPVFGSDDDSGTWYVLHDEPLGERGAFRAGIWDRGRDYCAFLWSSEDLGDGFFSGSANGCSSVLSLRDNGTRSNTTTRGNAYTPLAFFAVLPASHHGQTWSVEVAGAAGAKVSTTQQSLLVQLPERDEPLNGPPPSITVEVHCLCGDLSYDVAFE